MKRIDLTVRVHSLAPKMVMPTPFMGMAQLKGMYGNTLKKAVVEALSNYTDCTIEESTAVIELAKMLNLNPVTSISKENFELIEKALAKCSAEVKAAWNKMIKQLNMEE